jgi:fructosamine-3-kinase
MLNLNQLKEREGLRAQQAKLGDELAFAEEHKLPGDLRAGVPITPARYPARSMETTNSSRWWAKIFAAQRLSTLPLSVLHPGGADQCQIQPAQTSRNQPAERRGHYSPLW